MSSLNLQYRLVLLSRENVSDVRESVSHQMYIYNSDREARWFSFAFPHIVGYERGVPSIVSLESLSLFVDVQYSKSAIHIDYFLPVPGCMVSSRATRTRMVQAI